MPLCTQSAISGSIVLMLLVPTGAAVGTRTISNPSSRLQCLSKGWASAGCRSDFRNSVHKGKGFGRQLEALDSRGLLCLEGKGGRVRRGKEGKAPHSPQALGLMAAVRQGREGRGEERRFRAPDTVGDASTAGVHSERQDGHGHWTRVYPAHSSRGRPQASSPFSGSQCPQLQDARLRRDALRGLSRPTLLEVTLPLAEQIYPIIVSGDEKNHIYHFWLLNVTWIRWKPVTFQTWLCMRITWGDILFYIRFLLKYELYSCRKVYQLLCFHKVNTFMQLVELRRSISLGPRELSKSQTPKS